MVAKHIKILVIDPEPESAFTISETLKQADYEVIASSDALDAIRLAKSEIPQLILLDLLIPKMDGIDICYELRSIENLADTLIVFYTNSSEDYSQIAAFNAGADDYIIKPCKPRVLISRLKALLKRNKSQQHLIDNDREGLIIDREKYLVFNEGFEITLPRKQFELLALLYSSPQKVFTRKEIANLIWGYEIFSKNRTIDVHIRKLREKLGDKYIKTIKGIGYSLEL
jgi:two-component system alkaline phosphatase synthesis response regulator PhoP